MLCVTEVLTVIILIHGLTFELIVFFVTEALTVIILIRGLTLG